MNFEYFDKLSNNEAEHYLASFLISAAEGVRNMKPLMLMEGVEFSLSVPSIVPALRWIASKLKVVERAVADPDSRDSLGNRKLTQADFDGDSRILVLRGAYLLGESFVETFPSLKWGIGDAETAVKNMPAVIGFKHKMEMAPILVLENTFMRIAGDNEDPGTIERMIGVWRTFVPTN